MTHSISCPIKALFARAAVGAAVVQFLGSGVTASAQLVALESGNSAAQIWLAGEAGMLNWTTDHINVLNQQSFFIRTDSGTALPINSLAGVLDFLVPAEMNVTYTGPQLKLTTTYALAGGAPGSGTADLSEQIKIQNTGVTPLSLVFFQFGDFVGSGNVSLNANSHGLLNEASISDVGLVPGVSYDVAVSPGANRGMVGPAWTVLNNLLTVPGFTLSGPTTGTGAFALEWDRVLGAGQSLIVTEDLNVNGLELLLVPEPSSVALAGMGLLAMVMVKRMRKGTTGTNIEFRI